MQDGENLFILNPSTINEAGVGCFTMSYIEEGERINSDSGTQKVRRMSGRDIADEYLKYCPLVDVDREIYIAPLKFTAMSVFWYLNHARNPNLKLRDFRLFAAHNLEPDTELTIYYPDLLTHPKNHLWRKPEHI